MSEHRSHPDTVADLARLAAAAHGADTRIALEFMRFTEVRTLSAALSTVDEAGADDGSCSWMRYTCTGVARVRRRSSG